MSMPSAYSIITRNIDTDWNGIFLFYSLLHFVKPGVYLVFEFRWGVRGVPPMPEPKVSELTCTFENEVKG